MKYRSIATAVAALGALTAMVMSAGGQAPAWAASARPAAPAHVAGVMPAHSAEAPPAPAAGATTGTAAGAVVGPTSTRTVELPTGDQVRVADSSVGTRVIGVTGSNADSYTTVMVGGDTYVVPRAALSTPGTSLDPALFNVTHPVLASGQAQVAVTFHSGVKPHDIPGISTTSVSGSVLDGVITPASAAAFGQWLAQPAGKGHAPSPLAGVSHIAPEAAGPGNASPALAMETLTFNIVPAVADSSPGPALVVLSNVDGPNFTALIGAEGPVSLSVPKGNYSALAYMAGSLADGTAADWTVTNPQFTMNNDRVLTLDLGTAVDPVTATTAKPATEEAGDIEVKRDGAAAGGGFALAAEHAGFTVLNFVAPTTKAPSIGSLAYDFVLQSGGPDPAAPEYFYTLDFAGQGKLPADHQYVVSQSDLATIHESFGSAGAVVECPQPGHPWPFGTAIGGQCLSLESTPASVDHYVTARPDTFWTQQASAFGSIESPIQVEPNRDDEATNVEFRSYSPGEQTSMRWFSQPEAPNLLNGTGLAVLTNSFGDTPRFGVTNCAMCASGSSLDLVLIPRGTADTLGALDSGESASYQVSADGVLVAGGDLASDHGQLVTTVPMPADAQTYQIDYDVSRNPANYPLSTSTHTSWQIPATARQDLPAGWECTPSGGTSCSVVPVLDVVPNLPTSQTGALAPGTDTGSIDVSQLGGGDVAVSSVKVEASYDGGATWQTEATSAAGNGQYTVALNVPTTSDGFGNLRMTVQAAGGATFTQTITHAFAVSAS